MSIKNKIALLIIPAFLIIACRKHDPKEEAVLLGTINVDLNVIESVIRKKEALAGNMTCDAVKDYLVGKGHAVDFVVYNSGSIRYDHEARPTGIYPAGPFYTTDLSEMFPFGNTLSIVTLTGSQIREMFERSAAQLPNAKGPFLQVSEGFSVTIDSLGTPQLLNVEGTDIIAPGNRILNVKLNDIDLEPGTSYRVGMPAFIAEGFDGYVTLLNTSPANKIFLEDAETNAITDFIILNSPVELTLSNRIIYQ